MQLAQRLKQMATWALIAGVLSLFLAHPPLGHHSPLDRIADRTVGFFVWAFLGAIASAIFAIFRKPQEATDLAQAETLPSSSQPTVIASKPPRIPPRISVAAPPFIKILNLLVTIGFTLIFAITAAITQSVEIIFSALAILPFASMLLVAVRGCNSPIFYLTVGLNSINIFGSIFALIAAASGEIGDSSLGMAIILVLAMLCCFNIWCLFTKRTISAAG